MSDQTPVTGVMLRNKLYDKLKFVVQVVLPALGVLYASLAQYWDFPNVEGVVGTLAAVALFTGLLLGLSSRNFTSRAVTGTPVGEFVVKETVEGKKMVNLELNRDPADFISDDVISFHLKKEDGQSPAVEEVRDENLS